MLSQEAEKLTRELDQIDISPNFEDQIKRTAEKIRAKLSGATMENKRLILETLEFQAQYYFDEQRGRILNISCAIPLEDDQIVINPSPK